MEMTAMISVLTMKMMKSMNPIFLAISILTISLASSMYVYKNTITSWMAFVTILTFSSGMMTLFMYTASLTSNETSKQKKEHMILTSAIFMTLVIPLTEGAEKLQSMKSFSNKMMMMVMAAILIIAMLSVSSMGHHPSQTISSSF